MIPADQHIWRLSKSGDQNLGLACSEDGLCLGRVPLVERRGDLFLVRPKRDLERLLSRVCGAEIDVERLTFGLTTVASALAAKNLALAQIAAVHLRLPDLPDAATRAALEAQDLLIKGDRATVWNDCKHPRTGIPPNPGWFAPNDGLPEQMAPVRSAQRGRGERESEEILDPTGSVRQAVWDARISRLREIDPDNPNRTYFANPNSPPSPEALDHLDAAIDQKSEG
jgi:hypothetical protein